MSKTDLTTEQLRSYAQIGAEVELERIYRAFPQLEPGAANPTPTTTVNTTPAHKRGRMSVAQRKAISARMRKYWATRRKANGGAK